MTATKQNTAEAGRGSGSVFGERTSGRPWSAKGSTLAPNATGCPAPSCLSGGVAPPQGVISKGVCDNTSTFLVTGRLSDLHKKGLRGQTVETLP